ncbi:hemoglobin/transferrin/lactoferrin receptor protein [Neisseria sp. HSC-16F19]|nr:TonB-dependent hemoglobin/transferrin/lactoferrin family receptor [Neisseria sp. HSC-16F19]MCP2040332.1 hemoglobin/transferrin/lactoferrin receptor protein [Neisseria sp. HSC-16F19]
MKRSTLAMAVTALFVPAAYAADGNEAELSPIVVTADRHQQRLDQAAPNVAVINRNTLNQAAAQNLDDMMLYEAGVDVTSDNQRRGHGSVNIRGIDGNRILMMVDGIRIPESYAGGGPNSTISGRDLVEADTLKQVDIVKGPYSALYGSDALGGVVNMNTLSPRDLVDADKPWHAGLKYGYRSRDRSHGVTLSAAGYTPYADALLMLTQRRGHESKNRGDVHSADMGRTASNPQEQKSYNVLFKASAGNEQHRGEILFEQFRRKNDSTLLNTMGSVAYGPVVATTHSAYGYDRARRQRIEAGYRYRGEGALQEAYFGLYQQKLNAEDDTVAHESSRMGMVPLSNGVRYADYGFDQTTRGIQGRTVWGFQTGPVAHTLVAGAEYKHTRTERPRDSTIVNADGSISKDYAGSTFPSKTFPDSRRKTYSVYVQDSLKWGSGITLTPAVRFEKESLTPDIDQAYRNANPDPNKQPQKFSDSAITPSLRLSVPFGDAFTGFAGYSQGFRTPPFDTSTMAFRNTAHGYEILPNHDLKSERSRSLEAGLKFRNGHVSAQVTAFHNRYRDFISRQFQYMAYFNGRPLQIYQYKNLDSVKTHGLEIAARARLNAQWQLHGQVAWMRGRDGKGNNLDTALPLNGVVGVDYSQGVWGAGTRLRWAAAQTRTSTESMFKTPGYGVWDAGVWYKPHKSVELGLNVYNIGNKKYWQHADVAGVERSSTIDSYSQPGRNIAATVQLKF